MSIFDFFFGRSQNESKNRRGIKLNRRTVRTRNLAMEPLETRDLLSVTTGLIDDSAYSELRAQYPEFNLPANQSTLNVMTVDLDEGATALKLSDLKSAISQASSSTKSDLILVKTTDSANTITYSTSSDEIIIDIDSSQYGSVTIIGWGTKELTLNANQRCRVMSLSGNTNAYLGNITFTKGKTGSDASGGGIYHTSTGGLTLTNCNITSNYSAGGSGGGICSSSDKFLNMTNCTISGNSTSNNGGGIYSISSMTITHCIISNNSARDTYAYGGAIYSAGGYVTLTNCIISNNLSSYYHRGTGGVCFTSTTNANIVNCTITNNNCGIYILRTINSTSANINIYNSIVAENSYDIGIADTDGYVSKVNAYNSLSSYTSWSKGSNNITYDSSKPLFISSSDYQLAYNSQAINKGKNSYAVNSIGEPLSTDFAGIPRILGSSVDMGAYEYDSRTSLSIPNFSVIVNGSSVSVNILPVGNASSYRIEYSSNDDFTNSAIIDTQTTENILDGLQEAQTYYIRIKSIGNNLDSVYKDSEYSTTQSFITAIPLDAPEIFPLKTHNNTVVVADWSTVDYADGYTFEYQLDGSDNWITTTGLLGTTEAFVGNIGSTYNVRVKANGSGDYSDSDYSDIASITLTVPPTPLTSLALSSIAPEVGTEIIASLIPTDATADYQWFSGETLIEGVTGSTFIVTEDQIGQTITCVATGTGDYTGTVSATTAAVPVPVVPLDAPADLALSAENTAITATWSAVENASSYTLLYQIDGADGWTTVSDIQSSTASFIGIAGMTYNVKVQANGTGDYSDSEFSDALSIKLYIPITGLMLSTDSPIVGSTITASLVPTNATADYQWFSSETLIEGATGSTFIVTEDQIGQTITCVATGTGDYTGTVSMTTAVVPVPIVPLDAPADVALSVYNATVTASWSAVENASSYTLEYKPVDAENWTALPGLEDTTASFVGVSGTMYNVRVKAIGTGDYSDSTYAEINTDKPTGPVVAINANKVTVSWVDDSPAADSVRYRVAGTPRWTVKKLNAGITEMSFNATIGANYEIEVLLDQQENNVLQGSAIVLDQPRLTSIRNELKDDTFQVNVTNYAAKNLAANVKQAIVSVNGVMTTLKIADQQGETALANGGKVAFSNGLFTFSEMNSNTSYKVMISFSDGHSVSKASTALTVKTLKAPYLPPVIVSANAVSDTAITVTWETAYGKKSTTPAQKYTVQYSTDGNKWTNATTGATGNSYTIQRLKGGVEYQVRVLATKGAAFEASAPSGVLSAQTLTLPKTVLDKASVKDDTFKLDVTNYATSNLVNAPMLNVKSDKFGEAAIAIQNGSGSATFENGMVAAFENGALTFTNVPSNTQQKIQINFSDGVCTTAWSAALTVKTAIASYNKPILTNAEAVSSTSVLVEWSPAVGKNSDIPAQSYTVQYSTDGNRWTNANTKVVGTSFTITGLKTGTTYLVAVIANKDSRFNASLPSESLEVRML